MTFALRATKCCLKFSSLSPPEVSSLCRDSCWSVSSLLPRDLQKKPSKAHKLLLKSKLKTNLFRLAYCLEVSPDQWNLVGFFFFSVTMIFLGFLWSVQSLKPSYLAYSSLIIFSTLLIMLPTVVSDGWAAISLLPSFRITSIKSPVIKNVSGVLQSF